MLNFGAGINILTEGGSKLNWSVGARAYSQFDRTGFVAGGLDYNRFTSKFGSLKASFTAIRFGYEYFNKRQTFHVGLDAGPAFYSSELGGKDVRPIISLGPGIMLRRERRAIWDASVRYNYVTGSGWDWIAIRVGYGFRTERK